MSDQLQRVKFLKEYLPYSSGEMAGFPTETAAMLLRKGLAAYVDEQGNITQAPQYDSEPIQSMVGPQPTGPVISSGGNDVVGAMRAAAAQGEHVNPPLQTTDDGGLPPLRREGDKGPAVEAGADQPLPAVDTAAASTTQQLSEEGPKPEDQQAVEQVKPLEEQSSLLAPDAGTSEQAPKLSDTTLNAEPPPPEEPAPKKKK